tara:strand:+ start:148 stop:417 length:270 start_codon:yes stop_codon:yes gene_type:complete
MIFILQFVLIFVYTLFILVQYFDGGNMSIDTNSMASVLIDTHLDNIQQQQKQDALNYSIFELRATLKEISNEVDKLVQRVEQINTRNGS